MVFFHPTQPSKRSQGHLPLHCLFASAHNGAPDGLFAFKTMSNHLITCWVWLLHLIQELATSSYLSAYRAIFFAFQLERTSQGWIMKSNTAIEVSVGFGMCTLGNRQQERNVRNKISSYIIYPLFCSLICRFVHFICFCLSAWWYVAQLCLKMRFPHVHATLWNQYRGHRWTQYPSNVCFKFLENLHIKWWTMSCGLERKNHEMQPPLFFALWTPPGSRQCHPCSQTRWLPGQSSRS